MTLKIEVEVPFDVVNTGNAADYLKSALGAIGYQPQYSSADPSRSETYGEAIVGEKLPERGPDEGRSHGEAGTRKRGEPSPGKARRTKAEIAEDEAAEVSTGAISTGEERIDPAQADSAETVAQDAADEEAEVDEARDEKAPLTRDDVGAVISAYVEKFGMPAVQEDGPKIFNEALGAPPAGVEFWKLSLLPYDNQDKIAKVVATWQKAVELNPLKRALVNG